MDHGHDPGGAAAQGFGHEGGVHGTAPGGIDPEEPAADPLDDVAHAGPEDAVHGDEHLVAGFHQVDEAGFHAGAAGRRHRDRQRVLRLEEVAQQTLGFVHDGKKHRVQVADAGGGKSLQHAGRNVAGAGAHQQALSGVEVKELAGVKGFHPGQSPPGVERRRAGSPIAG